MTSHLNIYKRNLLEFQKLSNFLCAEIQEILNFYFWVTEEWQDTFIFRFLRSCILFGVAFRSQKLAIWIDFLMWNWFGFVCISKFIFAQWRCNFLVQTKTLLFLLATEYWIMYPRAIIHIHIRINMKLDTMFSQFEIIRTSFLRL